MLFPDDALFDYVLLDLADEVAARPAPTIDPLPCDRWIARSCLQKAIRRAQPEIALRALANLYLHDRRATWRHITIIALEDVGVANIDALAWIAAAQRNRQWRANQGGDWCVMAELVRQMAVGEHCQAACDLLLRALNDPALDEQRATVLEQTAGQLAEQLWNTNCTLETRAMAAMALGGGLAEGQQLADQCAVFDVFAEAGRSSTVVETCRAAWKISRNPMALLLPIIWEGWCAVDRHVVLDDDMPPVQMIEGVPGYALDQFTRVGNAVSRAWLKHDDDLRAALVAANIQPGSQARAVGDLLFIAEGSLLARRAVWQEADALRLPVRQLPTIRLLAQHLSGLARQIEDKGAVLATFRVEQYFSACARRSDQRL